MAAKSGLCVSKLSYFADRINEESIWYGSKEDILSFVTYILWGCIILKQYFLT